MNNSLTSVNEESKVLDEYISSKINMKFGMEVSVLVISTLLSMGGLIGKLN